MVKEKSKGIQILHEFALSVVGYFVSGAQQ